MKPLGRFSTLSVAQRLASLAERQALSAEEALFLRQGAGLSQELADALIENAIGFYGLPLGVVEGVVINAKTYTIPLVTEETSVLAALDKTSLWVRARQGELVATSGDAQLMIGQIHIPRLQNRRHLEDVLAGHKDHLMQEIHQGPAHGMAKRGGGVREIELRVIGRPDGGLMGVLHVYVDVCDAMGANVVVQIAEFLKSRLEGLTDEHYGMAILSNLADQKLTRVHVHIPGVAPALGEGIQEASLFAQLDPYRAVTHNKGLLNGMDGVAIATGNDWRALEAGLHGFAARSGTYRGLSTWRYAEGVLEGFFEGPVMVGIVGGITHVHPGARLGLGMLGVATAQELAHVIAGVGLLQNLGALRALVKGGLARGHMALHLDNLLMALGSTPEERRALRRPLRDILQKRGYLPQEEVRHLLKKEREL